MASNRKRARATIIVAGIVLGLFVPVRMRLLGSAVAAEPAKEGSVLEVITYYPNMPAAAIEKNITNRVERWVNQSPAVRRITSRSLSGVSIIRVILRNDVIHNIALKQIAKLALETLPTLPPDTVPPVTLPRDPRWSRPLGMVVVHGSASEEALRSTARSEIRERLRTIERLAAPVVRIRDIGRVEERSAPPTMCFRIDGRRAVGVPVYPGTDASPAKIAEKVSRLLPSLQKRMPRDRELRWVPFGREGKEGQAGDGLLTIYVRAPSSSPLAETAKRVAAVERLVEKSISTKERLAILAEIGMGPDWEALHTANAGPMDATIFVQLSRDRKLSAAAYAAKLRRGVNFDPQFADLSCRFASPDMPAPLVVRIKDGKPEEQKRLAKKVSRRLAAIKGTADVDIAQRRDAPFLVIKVNRDKAAAAGLSSREVLTQVLAVVQPRAVLDRYFWIEAKSGDEPSITIPLPNRKLDDLLNIEAHGPNQKTPIKLSSLASLQRIRAAVEIDHDSLQRVLNVRANIDGRDRREVIADIRKRLQEMQVPAGMKVELANEH